MQLSLARNDQLTSGRTPGLVPKTPLRICTSSRLQRGTTDLLCKLKAAFSLGSAKLPLGMICRQQQPWMQWTLARQPCLRCSRALKPATTFRKSVMSMLWTQMMVTSCTYQASAEDPSASIMVQACIHAGRSPLKHHSSNIGILTSSSTCSCISISKVQLHAQRVLCLLRACSIRSSGSLDHLARRRFAVSASTGQVPSCPSWLIFLHGQTCR